MAYLCSCSVPEHRQLLLSSRPERPVLTWVPNDELGICGLLSMPCWTLLQQLTAHMWADSTWAERYCDFVSCWRVQPTHGDAAMFVIAE